MTSRVMAFALLSSLLGGCGIPGIADDGSPSVLVPTTAGMIRAGATVVHRFTVQAGTSIEYTVENRSTMDPDRWDVAVLPAAEFGSFTNGQSYQALVKHEDVSTTIGTVTLAKAGEYGVALQCQNPVQDCRYAVGVKVTD
jgi:hypothetical protein